MIEGVRVNRIVIEYMPPVGRYELVWTQSNGDKFRQTFDTVADAVKFLAKEEGLELKHDTKRSLDYR